MIDKIFKLIYEADNAGLETEEFYRIAENGFYGKKDRKTIVMTLQKKFLEKTPVLILGKKGCSGCEEIKSNLKDNQVYTDADLFSEILAESDKKTLTLPIICLNGEMVADGEEIEKIKQIIEGVNEND